MPYQGGYTPNYNEYGNYAGRDFPNHDPVQQPEIYDQAMGAGAWPQPPNPSFFPPPQQSLPPQQPQYPHYQQQQFQQFNQYQQQPFTARQGQQISGRPNQSPIQLYGHNFPQQQQQQQQPQHQHQQRQHQQQQPASRYQNSYSNLPSSPDPLQYYQAPPQQFDQPSGQSYPQTQRISLGQIPVSRPRPSASPTLQHQPFNQQTVPQRNNQPQSQSQQHHQQHHHQQQQQLQQQQQQQQYQQHPRQLYQLEQPTVRIAGRPEAVDQGKSPQLPNGSNVKSHGHTMGQQTSNTPKPTPRQAQPGQTHQSNPVIRDQTNHENQREQTPRVKAEQYSESTDSIESLPTTIQPSMLQKKVTHVQIPARKPTQLSSLDPTRTPKRRKSNEGDTVPVHQDGALSAKAHQPPPPPSSSPLSELRSSQIPPTPAPQNINYQAVLLGLSDEYIHAAYSLSASVASADVSEEQLHQYHDLLAAGLGCLEGVLKNYRIPDARREAQIRLRFASILCEETENSDTAEEVLAKGITVCERARLTDLKYAMHHVLARVWFKGNKPRVALKAIEKLTYEVEKLELTHWVYAFRFLSVSLALQTGSSHTEVLMMTKQLAAISNTASAQSHVVIQIVAHTLEALLHLRSQTPEGVELAQRSIAAARTHQLSPQMESLPQIRILLDCIDLACSLMRFNADQITTKLKTMQDNLDGQAKSPGWSKDGGWLLPLGPAKNASRIEADTCGIMKTTADGQPALVFQWLPRSRVYMLGFLLSGLASLHKSTSKDRKAESFFKEGLKLSNVLPKSTLRSMTSASEEVISQQMMRVVLQLYMVFSYCSRSNWSTADKAITAIRKELAKIESVTDSTLSTLLDYLEAVSKHGQGDLRGALALYRSRELAFPSDDSKQSFVTVEPLRVLSALNSVLILRSVDKPGVDGTLVDITESENLLARLEPICKTQITGNGVEHGSKSLEAALNILKATGTARNTSDGTIVQTKQYLTAAAHAAKRVVDNRLMCVVMNRMTQLFFTSMIGEQAEKSAGTSRGLAEKSQDKLWTAVANHMYGDIMERSGKVGEAMTARTVAQESMQALPDTLKLALDLG